MVVGKLLSTLDTERLKKSVQDAESGTWGEVVPVVVHSSDSYPHHRWLTATALAFVCVLFAARTLLGSLWAVESDYRFELILTGVWLAALFFFHWIASRESFMRWLVPTHAKTHAVDQRAHRAFVEHGLPRAARSGGVLIFVSWFEKQIRIVADRGYEGKIAAEEWDRVRDLVVTKIRHGQLAAGLGEAILECGRLMARAHPAKPGERGASLIDDDVAEENT